MKIISTTLSHIMIVAAAAAGLSLTAEAKVAKQGPVSIMQPDGSHLEVLFHGDERAHYITDLQGALLTYAPDGTAVYADVKPSGELIPTDLPAGKASAQQALHLCARSQSALASVKNYLMENAKIKSTVTYGAATRGPGLTPTGYPNSGSPKALVILVEFSDKKFETPGPHAYFNNFLSQKGFADDGATGSVLDWFELNSSGKFTPDFDLYGPITLPQPMNYYGGNDIYGNDKNPEKMAIHACDYLDETVDFSIYDTDRDGYIDNVYLFYAGYGEADGGGKSTVWPHSWDIEASGTRTPAYDGVYLNHYACSNELDHSTKKPDGIGTFVHEFSHVLGLPDLYCTASGNPFTPGKFSVLDYGPYNNAGRTPPNYSTYERYALDWIKPAPLSGSGLYSIANLEDSNEAYMLLTENENEYFLFENRQQTGNDTYIPGHGMLVWHIDYDVEKWIKNTVNNSSLHQNVDLIEADNKRTEITRKSDPFPGNDHIRQFSFTTVPRLASWNSKNLGFSLSEIEENDGLITFQGIDTNSNGISSPVAEAAYKSDALLITALRALTVYTVEGRLSAILGAGESTELPARGLYIIKPEEGPAVKAKF